MVCLFASQQQSTSRACEQTNKLCWLIADSLGIHAVTVCNLNTERLKCGRVVNETLVLLAVNTGCQPGGSVKLVCC